MVDLERKLYVRNLPGDISDAELKEVFGIYGPLEEVVVLSNKTNDNPLRTALVKFLAKDEAAAAMAVLNDMYKFREGSAQPEPIRVSLARPREQERTLKTESGTPPPVLPPPAPGAPPSTDFGSKAKDGGDKLWVGNLPVDITDAELQKVFGRYGKVEDVNILPARSKSGQLCAFVRFSSVPEADACIAGMAGFKFRPGDGEEIRVERPSERRKGKDAGKGDWSRGDWVKSDWSRSSFGKGDSRGDSRSDHSWGGKGGGGSRYHPY